MLNINNKFPEKAIKFLIKDLEGIDITDNVNDYGGLTKFGISKNAYPDLDIKNLSYDEAVAIYIRDYWNKNKCDVLLNINKKAALILFFNSVNFGNKEAMKILQRSLDNLVIDGIIGKNTINAVIRADQNKFINNLILETSRRYAEISHIKNNKVFLDGWFNRVKKIIKFINDRSV